MKKVKYVFIILVYKNTEDLLDCIKSIKEKVHSYKVVVVNAYFDEQTKNRASSIAKDYQCDFIDIENKGYSYGNNRGIEFASQHYDYDYVIVSNPDIIVDEFDDSHINDNMSFDIIAPRITSASGRKQNPMSITRSVLSERLQYWGFKKNCHALLYGGILISKIKLFFDLFKFYVAGRHIYRIYCAHGSFVMLSKKTVKELMPIYDERMFLFAEEGVLAVKSKRAGLQTFYYDLIRINHKEDGSMKLGDLSENRELTKANLYFYENY